jgi:hypothetical protein
MNTPPRFVARLGIALMAFLLLQITSRADAPIFNWTQDSSNGFTLDVTGTNVPASGGGAFPSTVSPSGLWTVEARGFSVWHQAFFVVDNYYSGGWSNFPDQYNLVSFAFAAPAWGSGVYDPSWTVGGPGGIGGQFFVFLPPGWSGFESISLYTDVTVTPETLNLAHFSYVQHFTLQGPAVPDASSTFALLCGGLIGLAALRRRFAA